VARRKQIGQGDMQGDKGIALIHRIVNDMGFVWNALHFEAGIDGIIEIRDVVTAEVSEEDVSREHQATFPESGLGKS
jgi:hypothetical protein